MCDDFLLLLELVFCLIIYLCDMTVLFLISLFVIAIYIAVVIVKSGVPYSVSDTYYRIEHKKWFTFVMLATGYSLLPVALEVSSESSQFLIFLTIVGITLVGISPNFKGKNLSVTLIMLGQLCFLYFHRYGYGLISSGFYCFGLCMLAILRIALLRKSQVLVFTTIL